MRAALAIALLSACGDPLLTPSLPWSPSGCTGWDAALLEHPAHAGEGPRADGVILCEGEGDAIELHPTPDGPGDAETEPPTWVLGELLAVEWAWPELVLPCALDREWWTCAGAWPLPLGLLVCGLEVEVASAYGTLQCRAGGDAYLWALTPRST